jgi:hypothetical protein
MSYAEDVFWDVAEEFLARDGIEEGTMFGFRCIRADGEFVAMPGNTFGGLVVKLPANRVSDLIGEGVGSVVAPSGRPFREWVAVDDESMWRDLIEESIRFVS